MSNEDMLKYMIDNGMIDLQDMQAQIEMRKRNELLSMHKNKIWEGRDEKWRTYIYDENGDRHLIKRNSRKEIEDVIVEHQKELLDNPTIKDVFTEWNNRRQELNKISNATHMRNQQIYNRHYKEFGEYKIKSIDESDIIDFLEEQIAIHHLTAKAFANLKTITRGMLKYAKRKKFVSFNVEEIFHELDVSDVDFKKTIKEDFQEVFDEFEMPVIVRYLTENPDIANLGILLMFLTGMRVGEVVALKREDFDRNSIRIRRTETRYLDDEQHCVFEVKEFPKTFAGVRTVILPEDYAWVTSKLIAQNPFGEYIFMNNGRRMTTQTLRKRLTRICKKLDIYPKSPHKIRKTYGSILLDNKIDTRMIEDLMGHTSILCTENHYHRNRKSIDRKSKILSIIPDFTVNGKEATKTEQAF